MLILNESLNVNWGGFSLVKVELLLFKKALKMGKYDYFHLMSGQDLPIKPISEINLFFEKNKGKEFISFSNQRVEDFADRVMYYHVFQDMSSNMLSPRWKGMLTLLFLKIERALGIRRNTKLTLKKGSEWCSLTKNAVCFLLANQSYIKWHFGCGFCADEIYKQTMIWNSPLRKNIYSNASSPFGNMQLTLWDAGAAHPHTFTADDEKLLRGSSMLYARKFDENYIPSID